MPNIVQWFDGTGLKADGVTTLTVNVSGVLDQTVGVLPYILGTVVGFIAVRKGISFVKSMLQGA